MSNAPNGTTGPKLGQNVAQPNGIPPPPFELRNPRHKFLMNKLVEHLHAFARETSLTTAEWQSTIKFLTRTGQTCTPLRQEFILLSDVLGLSAVVDNLNHPSDNLDHSSDGKLKATDHTVLGPFFTEDAADVLLGESIASEGKGEYLFVEGRVLDTDGNPVPNAVIETWETDENGFYDTQYADREHPDCRGRLRSDAEGRYSFRAVVPVPYPIPGDGPVGELLLALNRHNMRPAHIHFMVTAPKMETLVTAIYPEGDTYLTNDAVFGVKRSLVVHFDDITDPNEGQKRGIPEGKPFKLLQFDIVLKKEDEGIEQPKSHL
ncbi:Intradiol ring-cleavage dioxygenase [Schizophyllum commune]